MSHVNIKTAKLTRIKQSLCFPGADDETGLPFLKQDVTSCTAIVKSGADDLEIDHSTADVLTEKQLINWCRTIRLLLPLKAVGQGSQFFCAVSMGLWSFSDGASLLQRLLYVFISEFAKDFLFERWVRNDNKEATELDFRPIIEMARGHTSAGDASFRETGRKEFPLRVHIFSTANILRRSIVVVGDEEDDRTGIYLPVLCNPEEIVKWPLVLALHEDSYFPLVNQDVLLPGQKISELAVPLVSVNLYPLKIHFLLETEEREVYLLLQKYLNVMELNLTRSSDICLILSAKLNPKPMNVEKHDMPNPAASYRGSELDRMSAVVPSAPSASIITLNNLSEAVHRYEEPRELSMLDQLCCVPGCKLFASKFTEPFCYEHVECQTGAMKSSEELVEASLVNKRCAESGCSNFASRFIYPYCYEHLDRKTVETTIRKSQRHQLPTGNDISVMAEQCIHPNCHNRASKHTYPVCYEHLGFPPDATQVAAVTQVIQISRPVKTKVPSSSSGISQEVAVDKIFEDTMKELEARSRNGVPLCLSARCSNFGNSKCYGYCHSCYYQRHPSNS